MLRAVLTLIFGNVSAKLLGLFREVAFAAWFGTSEVAAAYRIAQSLVFIFIHSVVGDTLAGTMLPLYQKLRAKSEDEGRTLLLIALGQGLLIGLVIGGCMLFFSRSIVNILAPGAIEPAKELATAMVRIMAFVAPVYIVGNTLAYIESAHGKYTALSSRTSLANFGIILAGGLAFYLKEPLIIAFGFVAIYVSFLALTLFDFYKTGLLSKLLGPISYRFTPILIKFEKNVASLIGILVLSQGNVFVERVVASWLGTAVIPGLDYARFLTDTVTAMIAVPLGIITMANHGASSIDTLKAHTSKVSKFLLLLTAPISLILCICGPDVVDVVYKHGKFDQNSADITSSILQGSASGLFATATAYFLIKSMNTSLRNKESLFLTTLAVIGNVAFNLLTWKYLGPRSLGIGNSIYGIVLFVSAATYLSLWKSILPIIAQLATCCAVSFALILLIPMTPFPLVNIGIRSSLVIAVWVALYFLSGEARGVSEPLVRKFTSILKRILPGSAS